MFFMNHAARILFNSISHLSVNYDHILFFELSIKSAAVSMAPNVVIIPTQGLANRFRGLASAQILADHYGTTLYVLWGPEDACNCELKDVLASPSFPAVNLEEVVEENDFLFRDQVHTNTVLMEEEKTGGVQSKWLLIRGGHEFKHPNMSESDFVARKKKFYSAMVPTDRVRERVEALGVSDDCVGIHFRNYEERFDQADGRMFEIVSPMGDFVRTVKLLRNFNPDLPIYLSTRNNELKQRLQTIDPPPLRLPVTEHTRNSLQGMEEAMVDWWALTRCAVIFGSDMSSFSDEAAICGDCPKVCIGSEAPTYHCYGSEFVHGCRMVNPKIERVQRLFD